MCVQAKEFCVIPGMLKHQRDQFKNAAYKSSNAWDRWNAIRKAIDPRSVFMYARITCAFTHVCAVIRVNTLMHSFRVMCGCACVQESVFEAVP